MTDIRDEFAMSILPAIYAEYFASCREQGTGPQDEHWRIGLALDAYMMADAMLKVRSLQKEMDSMGKAFGFSDLPEFPSIRAAAEIGRSMK